MTTRRKLAPAGEHLGTQVLAYDPGEGRIRIEFTSRPEFLNPFGRVQGGFLAAMMDSLLASAVNAGLSPEHLAVTVEMKVNYLRPAP